MIALPLIPSVSHYSFATTIENETYAFTMRWNARDAAWYMDVFTEAGDVLRQGVKVVLGAYLGRASSDGFFNKGVLVARDTSGQGVEAGYNDLGTRVEVVYLSALDIQAMLNNEVSA
jgi:hypothetical protein